MAKAQDDYSLKCKLCKRLNSSWPTAERFGASIRAPHAYKDQPGSRIYSGTREAVRVAAVKIEQNCG